MLALLNLRERTAAESQEVLDAAHAADVAAQADQRAAAAFTAEEEARQMAEAHAVADALDAAEVAEREHKYRTMVLQRTNLFGASVAAS